MHAPKSVAPVTPVATGRAALDFVHSLLTAGADEPLALDGLLGRLAEAFGAHAAGLASVPDRTILAQHPAQPALEPPSIPGGEVPGDSWAGAAPAIVLPRPGGVSIAAVVVPGGNETGASWLLWVEHSRPEPWSEAEAAALGLAGQVLQQQVARAAVDGRTAPRWARQLDRTARQQRLEIAADITRRLAHDYGNVLTSILGFSELALALQLPPHAALANYLGEVHRGAQDGAQLTQQLREFANRQPSAGRCADLPAVISEEQPRLRGTMGPAYRLELDMPTDLAAVALDMGHVRLVLAALLDNAREAVTSSLGTTGRAGRVVVRARNVTLAPAQSRDYYGSVQPGSHVEVVVADNGPGLSPEAARRLFREPFYSSRSRRRGYGLARAYGILHANHGGLDLRPGPEGGVEAHIVLPTAGKDNASGLVVAATLKGNASPGAEAAAPLGPTSSKGRQTEQKAQGTVAPGPSRPPFAGRGERVLIVDDDRMILEFVSRSLERAGYRTHAVASAEAALDAYVAASSDPFRVVLSDVLMPGIGGVDLAHRLLNRDAGVRVVFMTGQVSLESVQDRFRGSSFEVLQKPFRPEGLLRVVRAAIDRAPQGKSPVGDGGPAPPVAPSRPPAH